MIEARIIKDSINSATDDRLTTFILTYPRFVHAEFMTHRMLSKNSASTRAIPTAKIIQAIKDNPAMPEFWGKNQAGMQALEELDNIEKKRRHNILYSPYDSLPDLTDLDYSKDTWLKARDTAIHYVEALVKLGLHKQIAGRILEPWFNITVLVSGTEWENFFALRAHKDAQPEIRVLAEKMLEAYNKSIPNIKIPCLDYMEFLKYRGSRASVQVRQKDWHLPFEDQMPKGLSFFDTLRVSIARCARLSYLTFDGEMNVEKDFEIYDRLLSSNPKHASPAEHVAFPITESKFIGNFKGWAQFRKMLPEENQIDSRVIKRYVVDGKVM